MFTTIMYPGWTKPSEQVHLSKLHYQRWTAQVAKITLEKEEDNRMLLTYFPVLSTTISSSLPKTWVLGKTLYSSPCMIISWLQLHRDLERKTYGFLVLFITNAWREMKQKGHGSKQGQLSQNTICSGNFEQVQYFRPLNCTDYTYWMGRRKRKKRRS